MESRGGPYFLVCFYIPPLNVTILMSSFRHNAAVSACSDGIAASSFEAPPADLRLQMPIYITHLCSQNRYSLEPRRVASKAPLNSTSPSQSPSPSSLLNLGSSWSRRNQKPHMWGLDAPKNITMLRSWCQPSLVWNFLD